MTSKKFNEFVVARIAELGNQDRKLIGFDKVNLTDTAHSYQMLKYILGYSDTDSYVLETLGLKAKEYAEEDDRFENFNAGVDCLQNAYDIALNADEYALCLQMKHIVWCEKYIKNILEKGLPIDNIDTADEDVALKLIEHFGDVLNYNLLIEAMQFESYGLIPKASEVF